MTKKKSDGKLGTNMDMYVPIVSSAHPLAGGGEWMLWRASISVHCRVVAVADCMHDYLITKREKART